MNNKPRKPWLAGLLTFCTVGLGHIYAGNGKKGVILHLSQVIIIVPILIILVKMPNVYSISLAIILALIYFIYCLIDAIKIAKRKRDSYTLKRYNKWYLYLLFYILANIIIQPTISYSIKENIIKAYKIPSGAMLPTLLIGDHILVNRYIYNKNNPRRGDIIVFEHNPKKSIDYVKRIVAIPGDAVEIRNKTLFINNEEQQENFTINSTNQILPTSSPRDNYGPVTVPDNSFFVLGDNRDNSFDSRFWGFVNKAKIRGKVTYIYWSWDIHQAILSLKRWRSIRWDRIGRSTE